LINLQQVPKKGPGGFEGFTAKPVTPVKAPPPDPLTRSTVSTNRSDLKRPDSSALRSPENTYDPRLQTPYEVFSLMISKFF
jgi:hypothetical protein